MLYILTGPNSYTKRLRIQELVGQPTEAMELTTDDGLGRWFEVVGQSDLFGQAPPIIGRYQFDEWSAKDKEQWRRHLAQFADPANDLRIVLLYQKSGSEVADELADWRKSGAVVEQFDLLSQPQMIQWLKQRLADADVVVENRWLPGLAQAWGGDQQAAVQQIELWSLAGLQTIGQTELLELGVTNDDSSIFDLTDSWARQRPAPAIKQLHELVDKSVDPKQVIAMLAWQIELLRAAQLRLKADAADGPASKAFNSTALQKAGRLANSWSEQRLLAATDWLIALDTGSRTGEVKDLVLALELWIYRTCTEVDQFDR